MNLRIVGIAVSLMISGVALGGDFISEARRLRPAGGKTDAPLITRESVETGEQELFEANKIDIVGLKAAKSKGDKAAAEKILADLDSKGTKLAMAQTKADQDKGDSAWYIYNWGNWGWWWQSYFYTTWWIVQPVLYYVWVYIIWW